MRIFAFIAENLLSIIVPVVVFIESLIVLLWLRKFSLSKLTRWSAGVKWAADAVICEPVKRPFFILCIVLSAYLGFAVSAVPDNWKSLTGHSLWTLFTFTIIYGVLNIVNGFISVLGNHWNLPNITSSMRTVSRIVIILVSMLIVLSIWGVPAVPLLLLVAVVSVLILLTVRDAAPNLFATLELIAEKKIKVGADIKLENGIEGRVIGMGWTSLHLQTVNGDNLIIPNGQLTRQIITRINNHGPKNKAADLSSSLTKREVEIVNLINRGAKNKDIAEKLFISENTAKVHVKNILKKLELKSRQQLIFLSDEAEGD
jgi:DNA-binding CsgD family transcriptional regulator